MSGRHFESRSVFSTKASFKAGMPPAGVYLCDAGLLQASTAASTICSGVAKSGSPAPKPITGSPAAFKAFAFLSTAIVADSAIAPMRLDNRDVLIGLH